MLYSHTDGAFVAFNILLLPEIVVGLMESAGLGVPFEALVFASTLAALLGVYHALMHLVAQPADICSRRCELSDPVQHSSHPQALPRGKPYHSVAQEQGC